jgi:ubiquinone/menaquinone biosynthesis C-methylase UbiE
VAVKHPVFARMYQRMAPKLDEKGGAEHRDELLADLRGRVIEVGAGAGANFPHYPATVEEVVAVEPEPYLRERAREAAQSAPVPVRVVEGEADALPARDQEFDAGIASLVLCSVPDQDAALAELHRVIKPGGELRFYEHVAARGRMRAVHRRIDPVYTRFAGGCHLTRDTTAAIERCGFRIQHSRRFPFPPGILALPHVIGVARRSA